MEENFHGINFAFEKNRPVEGGFSRLSGLSPIIEVQIAGEDGPIDARQFNTSEKRRLGPMSILWTKKVEILC